MKATISYQELSEYIQSHYGQKVGLAYVDDSSVQATASIRVMKMPVTVALNLKVESACGSVVRFTYDGNFGVDLLVTAVLRFLSCRLEESVNFVKYDGTRLITLYLDQIKQLESAFTKIQLEGISFDTTDIIVNIGLI